MILVGTSAGSTRIGVWRFYRPAYHKRQWLDYYAERFATVEIQQRVLSTFPNADTFAGWRARTAGDTFFFAVKRGRVPDRTSASPRRRPNRWPGSSAALTRSAIGSGRSSCNCRRTFPPMRNFWTTRSGDSRPRSGSRSSRGTRRGGQTAIREVVGAPTRRLVRADRRGRPVTPLWRTADWGYLRDARRAPPTHIRATGARRSRPDGPRGGTRSVR